MLEDLSSAVICQDKMASSTSETINDIQGSKANSVIACLQISEIFDIVLKILEMHWESQLTGGMTTISALAATCKAFYEPSMNYLWAMIPDLTPVIMSLPPHTWHFNDVVEESEQGGRKHVHIERTVEIRGELLQPSDWDRPLRNARRVKEFTQEWDGLWRKWDDDRSTTWRISREALVAVSLHCRGSGEVEVPHPCLFPNALRFEYDWQQSHAADGIRYLPYLVSERVETIWIATGRLPSNSDETEAFIVTLQDLSKRLLHIRDIIVRPHFYAEPPFWPWDERIDEVLAKFTKLRSLPHFKPYSVDALKSLAQLTELEDIAIDMTAERYTNYLSTITPRSTFSALRLLRVSFGDLTNARPFMAGLASPQLGFLHVSCTAPPTTSNATHLFLYESRHLKSLHTIRLEHVLPPSAEEWANVEFVNLLTSPFTINPLFQLPNLTSITISVILLHGVDDNFIADVAQTWPNLQHLSLTSQCQISYYRPILTLEGLLPLAEHCRRLSSISIGFDAVLPSEDAFERAQTVMEQAPREHPLNSLEVQFAYEIDRQSDFGAMADFLIMMFPNLLRFRPLSYFQTTSPQLRHGMASWMIFLKAFRDIQDVRLTLDHAEWRRVRPRFKRIPRTSEQDTEATPAE